MHTPAPWITFDCYGTLVDWNSAFVQTLIPFAGPQTARLISTYHDYERQLQMRKPFQRYRDLVVAALLTAAAETGTPLSLIQAREIITRWHEMPLFADTEPMLAALRAQGFKLGVLTNCDNDLFELTHRSFEAVITSESVNSYKPGPTHFQSFWRKTKVDRCRWIHIGSSCYHDIYPAKASSIKSIWLDRGNTCENLQSTTASARIFSVKEVPEQVLAVLETAPLQECEPFAAVRIAPAAVINPQSCMWKQETSCFVLNGSFAKSLL